MDNLPPDDKHRGLELVSASGLDERQIAPVDIAALNALFRSEAVPLDIGCGICSIDLEAVQPKLACSAFEVGLGIPEPRPLRIKVEPLPRKVKTRRMPLKTQRIKTKANQPASMAQLVSRKKMRLSMLSEKQQENMSKELFKKYGAEAQSMYLVAAYANIPPESAKSIRLDNQLRFATFIPNHPGRNQGGYYLLILERKDGQTEKVLVRL